MSENTNKRRSYHTFLYPFHYGDTKDPKKSNLSGVLKKSEIWEQIDHQGHLDAEEYKKVYKIAQFYLPKARRMLLPSNDKNETELYRHKGENIRYEIVYKEEKISLDVTEIELLLLPIYSIGLLTIKGEYVQDARGKNDAELLEMVDRINDLGRRVYPASVEVKGNEGPKIVDIICPAELNLYFDLAQDKQKGKLRHSVKYQDFVKTAYKNDKYEVHPELIEQIIYYDGQNKKKKSKPVHPGLKPVLDDRMFVTCLYIGLESPESYWHERLENPEKAEELYKFMFLENSCTCQDQEMLQEKLDQHIYRRWVNWGSLYGITEYSMTYFASGNIDKKQESRYLVDNFQDLYLRLAQLALLQRAIITQLETEVEIASRRIGKPKELLMLWERYARFQAEYYIPEATFQEQGVEMYDMLKDSLRLPEMYEYLDSGMENLRELAQMYESDNTNNAINAMTAIGTTVAIFAMTQDYMIGMEAPEVARITIDRVLGVFWNLGGLAFFVVINGVLLFLMNLITKGKKSIAKYSGMAFLWIAVVILVVFMYCHKV
ncbi:MAG: hypothetical protein IJ794_13960 [Lachnospiraceae bacterium]|nr:hypothetical protein [Lachnospiraceae bacterium]